MNKEELQKIASTMTKDEFIDKYHYNSSDCPEDYGLKESSKICNGSGNCTKCWEEAICELEFKEDNIKNENKEKELNIIEASNLKNTEFKVIDSEGYQLDDNIKTNSNGNFLDMCGNLISSKLITYDLINAKFIPVKKPVTINEVLNSNKLCKIKHKDLYYRNESYYKEYHSLEDLLHELTEDYSDARTILREAEWYLQED